MSDTTIASLPMQPPSASEQAVVLRGLASIALKSVQAELDGFAARLEQVLAAPAGPDAGTEETALRQQALLHLGGNRVTFLRVAQASLKEALQRSTAALLEQGAMEAMRQAMDLAPDTFAAMGNQALVDDLAQAIDRLHAESLADLGRRLAQLLQGDDIPPAQNPFRAAVFIAALAAAWSRFDMNEATRAVVMRQWRPENFLQFETMFETLKRELGGQLASFKIIDDTPSPDSLDPRAQRRLRLQQRLRGWRSPLKEADAEQLFGRMLDKLRERHALPAELSHLLLAMQHAVSGAAASATFFLDEFDAARRLLEAMTRNGMRCSRMHLDADPLFGMLERIVERLQREPVPQAGLFDHLHAALEDYVSRQQAGADPRLREAIAVAAQEERHEEFAMRAAEDIASRVETGEVAGFVEIFLRTQWVQVLTCAHGMSDTKPEALASLRRAMDDLIWSVQPKSSPEERKEMVLRLPAMLSLLNAWLNVVKWEGPERKNFFATLAERHAAVVRTALETMPRQQLEIAMNIAQRASEHRINRRVQDDEVTLDPATARLRTLAVGDYLGFAGGKAMRLCWTGPRRTRFVFAGVAGEVAVWRAERLAQAVREGQACEPESLLQPALEAALDELAGGSAGA
jgi:Protein of unknown function (DUF1631)